MNTIPAVVSPVVALVDGRAVTTSQNIAAVFRKDHGKVLRSIRDLNCSPAFNEANFGLVDYADEKGEMRPAYTLTRDGCAFLIMGFTGKRAAAFKERYIAAFNAMEAELLNRTGQPAFDHQPLTAEHARRLQEAVAARAMKFDGKARAHAFAVLWGGIKTRFNVPTYRELPDHESDAAIAFVTTLELKLALPSPEGAPNIRAHRWLLSWDMDGTECMRAIPNEACVMTVPQLLKALATPGELPVDTETLMHFIAAAANRLALAHQSN
ncbi:MAG TPA: Rha family transcriptional regulator, partial [Nevskiaceae bacterium]|nr:Rha family transcriptional regulator [Nevskiaceae bacterium]